VLEHAGIHVQMAAFETPELREVLTRGGHSWTKAREMVRGFWHRTRTLADLDEFDVVFIYREAALLGPALFERWVASRGKPIIYQLDDPLYVPYVSPANGYLSYLKFFGKVETICRLSRTVIVNAAPHRDFAAQFNRNVREIPSLVDGEAYRFVPPPVRETPCIGWSGSSSTAGNLSLVEVPLRELARRIDFDLHLIGSSAIRLPGLSHTAQDWRAETEVADLRRIDIGLVPLPDNPWNRKKFYLKVVQYMALGIVPVATPLGSNPEVIEHGVTGFLARSDEDWVQQLERLVRDPELRRRMSQNAAAQAHAKFTLSAQAPAIVEAFRSASSAQTARG
jgi:glycosyltransferase involved in cell wall biosynthesis